MSTPGHDPAKLLRWIIKETAVPHYANNPPLESKENNNDENKSNIPITRLADLGEEEKKKWTNIILGQTPDLLNNRQSLVSAINNLHQLKTNIAAINTENLEKDPNEEIKACLYIIHHLLDKNEAVIAKLNGIPLLLDLIYTSMDMDNEICLDSCTILHDATQNNPMMQNHIYSHNGIQILLKTLKNCKKHNYKIRSKLWALIHVICREHNPNFNIFLTNSGHREINRVLRIEQSNINDNVLKEILRVSRLINYMFATWSDGNDQVFDTLNILQSVNWAVYSLHSFVIRLVSTDTQNPSVHMSLSDRLRRSQLVLDILMELVDGIRMFIKRDDKCKKFVIANRNNKDIVSKLGNLQRDLASYCNRHRPALKLEEKRKNGRPYKFRYYVYKNDDGRNDNDDDEQKEKDEGDDGDHIYLAMKDIWNTINSVQRHVKRYNDHCKEQKKLREIWRKTTKKGQQMTKKMRMKKKSSQHISSSSPPPSTSPPPKHQYQLVLYKKKDAPTKKQCNKKQGHKNIKKKKHTKR